MFGKVLAGVAAISLVAAPVAAQEASIERSAAAITQGEGLEGENSTGLLAMLAVIAIIVTTAIIVSDDDDADDQPTSP
ncbi:hypothetical protein [Aurantiacibacter sp. D1-12]|uniref:hypothetical protein n=1 Tax=Aurantiacibacter sp. D1-12 TaxID=2993658 RepID=UPI00237C9153|nr:hypothetical protein [Aurantiacibacter sp. D1-12]MDE1466963.1 hypothetical protein [Aurantiacibacter sp. D1-12]